MLEGQYRIDSVVGEGGFGVVYRGRHISLDQPIAVKVLKGLDGGDAAINALVLEKFRAEARLLYTLSQGSLHIVRSLDYGAATVPSGAWAPFMVLEWLDGRSLSEDLEERRKQGLRGRSVAEALAILEPAAEGLSIAHQRQVAHRDVKPANIFLLADGPTSGRGRAVKVLDFGIAKIMKEGEAAGTKGTFASFTWQYAAPEQLDPRLGGSGLPTDVYAFALVLTELLTDRKPIEDRDVVGIMRTATDRNRRPTPRTRGANVPDAYEAVCLRALAVDPKSRFANIGELWAALTAAQQTRGSTAMQPASQVTGAMPMSTLAVPGGAQRNTVLPVSSGVLSSPRNTAMPMSVPFGPPPGSAVAPPVGPPPPTLGSPYQTPPGPPTGGPPHGTPPPGTVPPFVQPGYAPPPGTAPPMSPPFAAPIVPYPAGPPPGTAPPGQAPQIVPQAHKASPVVIITVVCFVVALLFAGSCAIVQGACNAAANL